MPAWNNRDRRRQRCICGGLIPLLLLLVACDITATPPAARTATATATRADTSRKASPGATGSPRPQPTQAPSPIATPDQQLRLRQFLAQSNLFAFIAPDGALRLATPSGQTIELGSHNVSSFAWSPDGTRIAVVSAGGLYVLQPTQGTQGAQPLLDGIDAAQAPSWSPDGTHIVVARGQKPDIALVDLAGGKTRILGSGLSPLFAPQGRTLVAGTVPDAAADAQTHSAPLFWPHPDAAPLAVATAKTAFDRPRMAWSLDGALVAAGSVVLDREGQIVERLAVPGTTETSANGVSPGGRWIAVATQRSSGAGISELRILDRRTGRQRAVWTSAAAPRDSGTWAISQVIWSPDGSLLAFTGAGQTLGSAPLQGAGLWVGTADGSELGPLPETAGAQGQPRFAYDRSLLLFVKQPEKGEPTIWGWAPGSSQAPGKIVEGAHPAWRP